MFMRPSFWSLCQSHKTGNMKALSRKVANTQVLSSFSSKMPYAVAGSLASTISDGAYRLSPPDDRAAAHE